MSTFVTHRVALGDQYLIVASWQIGVHLSLEAALDCCDAHADRHLTTVGRWKPDTTAPGQHISQPIGCGFYTIRRHG